MPLAVLGLMTLATLVGGNPEWWEFTLPVLMLVLSVELLVFGIHETSGTTRTTTGLTTPLTCSL